MAQTDKLQRTIKKKLDEVDDLHDYNIDSDHTDFAIDKLVSTLIKKYMDLEAEHRILKLLKDNPNELSSLKDYKKEADAKTAKLKQEAETAKQEAATAKQEAEAAKQVAEKLKQEAETAKQEAATAKQEEAEAAKQVAEFEAAKQSLSTKTEELEAKTVELETNTAELKQQAETAKQEAATAKQEAEAAKQVAEAAKQVAEAAKQEAEKLKQEAEKLKQEAVAETEKPKQEADAAKQELKTYILEESAYFQHNYGDKYNLHSELDNKNVKKSPTSLIYQIQQLISSYKNVVSTTPSSKYELSEKQKNMLYNMKQEATNIKDKTSDDNVRIKEAEKNVDQAKSEDEAKTAIEAFRQLIDDIKVDVLGKVRVCIKIYTPKATKPQLLLRKDRRNVVVNNDVIYGPFWSVSESETNQQFYGQENDQNSIAKLVSQVISGYSIIIMAVGASGSGKTFSMSGEKGLQALAIHTLIKSGKLESLQIKGIFEDSMEKMDTKRKEGAQGNIRKDRMKTLLIHHDDYCGETLYNKSTEINAIAILAKVEEQIKQKRLVNCRILGTINNPESSRSHLCILLEATFENDVIGYLTFFDMAGRESPQDIFLDWKKHVKDQNTDNEVTLTTMQGIDASECVTVNQANVKSGDRDIKGVGNFFGPEKKATNRTRKEFISLLMQQGVFINESMNLLEDYILTLSGQKPIKKHRKYDGGYQSEYVLQQEEYEKALVTEVELTNAPNIIYLLLKISKLSANNSKPAKIVIVGTLENNKRHCEVTLGTLAFLQKLLPNHKKPNNLPLTQISMQKTDGSDPRSNKIKS